MAVISLAAGTTAFVTPPPLLGPAGGTRTDVAGTSLSRCHSSRSSLKMNASEGDTTMFGARMSTWLGLRWVYVEYASRCDNM